MIRWFQKTTVKVLHVVIGLLGIGGVVYLELTGTPDDSPLLLAAALVMSYGLAGLLMSLLGSRRFFELLAGPSEYRNQADDIKVRLGETEVTAEREALERQLQEVKVSAAFEDEGRSAFRVSWFTFVLGVGISLGVVGFGIWEWSTAGEAESLSTGTGIARVGVIAAAFYVAGQLFRRSTTLQIRSQEFSRAAIAMDITDNLAERITDDTARDGFLIAVYQHHLTGTGTAVGNAADAGGGIDVVKLAEAAAKLKGI